MLLTIVSRDCAPQGDNLASLQLSRYVRLQLMAVDEGSMQRIRVPDPNVLR